MTYEFEPGDPAKELVGMRDSIPDLTERYPDGRDPHGYPADDEPECCNAACDVRSRSYNYDMTGNCYCKGANCQQARAEENAALLARALQNVLDGVHGAKDAAKALLAKWRKQ